MTCRELLANWIAVCRKFIEQMKNVRQIAPENLLFQGAEAEGRRVPLLNGPRSIAGLQPTATELVTKPVESFRRKIVPQEFDGLGVRQVQLWINVQAPDPRP